MKTSSVSHLSNAVLRRELVAIATQDRSTTARLLVHMAEFDSRQLYREDGYPSMFAYCVGDLRMSEDMAYKRIRAARAARRFPRILASVADGTLTLSAVVLLARHLTQGTAKDLLVEAAGKTNAQIRQLLAERFPQPDLPTRVVAVASQAQLAVRPVVNSGVPRMPPVAIQDEPAQVTVENPGEPLALGQDLEALNSRFRVAPLSPQRCALQPTMSQSMHDKLCHAQDLLGHQVPSGDVVQVLDRALDALLQKLEKTKFGATDKPRQHPGCRSTNPRSIPASVRRAVSERDGGRCTFVGENGHRCEARKMLEFDHICEVARGGQATAGNLRLRCRAHNQYAAELTYGADLMKQKRQDAQRAAADKRARAAAQEEAARQRAREKAEEVIPWLRALGIRADQASHAARRCETMPDASLEERVKAALSYFGSRAACLGRAAPA